MHSPDPRFTHLSDANVFFKEHVSLFKNPGHIQIIQFADETHLTQQKSNPIDPDSPGHLTHFQPYTADFAGLHAVLQLSRTYKLHPSYNV